MARALLLLELLVLFIGLPLGYRLSPWPIPPLPILWVVSGYAWWKLSKDASFDRKRLLNLAPLSHHLGQILPIFLIIAFWLWVGVHWFVPQLEFSFMRRNPAFWALVMVLYPVLSVYPQGLLYRAFFLHRYVGLFPATKPGHWMLLLASATAFGFLHIIFRNPLSVVLTFFGGILFACRYEQTESLLASSFEHALYGCWLFTVGLGQYFYHGVWQAPR